MRDDPLRNTKKLLNKELKLSTSKLTWLFLAFGLMTLIPGYPILMGAFFICFGIFQSVQLGREANDFLYSALLPIRKRDVVTAKYCAAGMVEMIGFFIMALLTVVRLTIWRDAPAYVHNALLAANLAFLGFALVIFGLFNILFFGGFFKTAYYFGKPFVTFIIPAIFVVGLAETLPHLPKLAFLNATGGDDLLLQIPVLIGGCLFCALGTLLSMKKAQERFERIDL